MAVIRDRRFALIYRCAAFLLAIAGILDTIGLWSGDLKPSYFMYYTIDSNVLMVALFGLLIIKTARALREQGPKGPCGFYPVLGMIVGIDIFLTLVGYWVILAPLQFTMNGESSLYSFSNLTVHLIAPLLGFLDFVLFSKSKSLRYKHIYLVVIFPLLYVAFTSIAGLLGYVFVSPFDNSIRTRFAYFFIDFDQIGLMVFAYIGALAVFFLIFSHLLYLFDSKVTLFNRGKDEGQK
ncbi:MAG: Pr6Pr family membrane protein [Clostridiales bacterium]|jgi:hypothetical protein|nr:Pr6Pr family membrane protein [Clostridiales bacterium]